MDEITDHPDPTVNSEHGENSSARVPARIDSSYEPMTEAELIRFLRIPEISNSKDHHSVVENLKRMHQLPRIHICGKPLYPREAIREWIKGRTKNRK
jgi:hypothetical protein